MNDLFPIVHEDSDLLVINKPADLVCHPTKSGPLSSLISRVRLYLGEAIQPHLINRLDRETSGLVIVAKNPAAALDLRRLWEAGAVCKRYLAIVHGQLAVITGVIDAPLGRDETSIVAIKNTVRLDGSTACTEYEVLKTWQREGRDFSLLSVRPRTGRKHQIRIHLAHLGHPIVGDKLYGGDETCYLNLVNSCLSEVQRVTLLLPNHALHAESIGFFWREREVTFRAEPDSSFTSFAETAHGQQLHVSNRDLWGDVTGLGLV